MLVVFASLLCLVLLFVDLPSSQCPRVFIKYGESCYKFENNTKTFDESLDACRKLHKRAELISVNSGFEQGEFSYCL